MGLNVVIYIKAWDKSNPVIVPRFTVEPFCFGEIDPPILHAAGLSRDGDYPEGQWQATHRLMPGWRYYSPDCQRGPWDEISKLLRTVMGAENVRSVWYLSDDDDYPFRAPISGFDIDQMENFYASSMGNIDGKTRDDAKRNARLFVSSRLTDDANIVRIAEGKMTITFTGPDTAFDD